MTDKRWCLFAIVCILTDRLRTRAGQPRDVDDNAWRAYPRRSFETHRRENAKNCSDSDTFLCPPPDPAAFTRESYDDPPPPRVSYPSLSGGASYGADEPQRQDAAG